MQSLWFRFKDERGVVTHTGLVTAPTLVGLFWEIDQFGDPFSVEVATVRQGGGFCVPMEMSEDGPVPADAGVEISDHIPMGDDETRWKPPVWPKLEEIYQ